MNRLKFMAPLDDRKPTRVPAYLLPPRFKLDKDNHRVVTLTFSVKFNAVLAMVCDEKLQRAFEDCETLEREIDSVKLNSVVRNTDVEFYELPESSAHFYELKNTEIDGLYVERVKGQTYLYFTIERRLNTLGLGPFALERYGTNLFCEFAASQFAMTPPEEKKSRRKAVKEMTEAAAQMTAPLLNPNSGIDSLTIKVEGREAVTLDKQDAKRLAAAAKKAKEN